VDLHLTPEAIDLVRRKGGTIALDHIRAVG
jgi:hypothetical protein